MTIRISPLGLATAAVLPVTAWAADDNKITCLFDTQCIGDADCTVTTNVAIFDPLGGSFSWKDKELPVHLVSAEKGSLTVVAKENGKRFTLGVNAAFAQGADADPNSAVLTISSEDANSEVIYAGHFGKCEVFS
ncbi:hypothetical protein [Shimia sp. Alg240-R146]|uniref:hypothetical protein n=1 Tax=Shimia sp. Alg240-R146 TaxID=2993449 RepID=UPI0022DFC352|nr:hypothetical protein [Shimia sp. Alg240-R146]